ncbi:unnamed protein product [marine sediment metagenome]|uniref:Uncharacterized protein n=1 Tax=marine sediment metagenome TaxID=412755 RepID=X1RUP5_9ZZZZ
MGFTEYERLICSPGELLRTMAMATLPGKTGIIDTGNEGRKEPEGSFAGPGFLPGRSRGFTRQRKVYYPRPELELLYVSLSVGVQNFNTTAPSERGEDYGYPTREGKFR